MEEVKLKEKLELLKPWMELQAGDRDIAEYTRAEFGVSPLQFTAVTLEVLKNLRINTDLESLAGGLSVGNLLVIAVTVPIPSAIDAVVGFIQGPDQSPLINPGDKISKVYTHSEDMSLELSVKRL